MRNLAFTLAAFLAAPLLNASPAQNAISADEGDNMFTSSSTIHPHGSTHAVRRAIGLVSGIALVLMLSGEASARPLPVDSSEPRAVVQRTDHQMLLMLKLRTNQGFQVLVYG